MTAYEFLLSESQERMLFVVKAGREEALMQRFRRWGLQAAVVGRVLEEPIVRVLHHGAVAAEVPATALADDTPIEKHALLEEPLRTCSSCGNGMNRSCRPSRTREQLCLRFWMTRPLRASAGFTGNTTSRCWPTRWCRPVLPMPLSCGSGPNRERSRPVQSGVWRPRWTAPTDGLPLTLNGGSRRLWLKLPAISVASVPNPWP